jgi:hypothetical protein
MVIWVGQLTKREEKREVYFGGETRRKARCRWKNSSKIIVKKYVAVGRLD